MYKDYRLDSDFAVESNKELIDEIEHDLSSQSVLRNCMSPCNNCGEFVTKEYLINGLCRLCRKSETHKEIRGTSCVSSENKTNVADLTNEFND